MLLPLLWFSPTTAAPYQSVYREPDSPSVVIAGVTILTAARARIEEGFVVIESGGIKEFGEDAWDADPLEVTSQADLVYIDGEPVVRVNRQQSLREGFRALPGSGFNE